MISRKVGTLLFAMAACAMPGPALASYPGEGPIYTTYYYSGPGGYGVGTHYGACLWTGPVYHAWLDGQTSAYSEDVYAGYCREGVWEPI